MATAEQREEEREDSLLRNRLFPAWHGTGYSVSPQCRFEVRQSCMCGLRRHSQSSPSEERKEKEKKRGVRKKADHMRIVIV
ncbi:hypothetical protein AMECASPLE_004755 [Ameca splendens]|uniref:Uncharacterized protein n=1 Tax=Ameca splendens TaxID=208324 RepID=A0ABV0XBZ0_9TELE